MINDVLIGKMLGYTEKVLKYGKLYAMICKNLEKC